MKSKILLALVVVLALFTSRIQAQSASCMVYPQFQQTSLVATVGEIQVYKTDKYYEGYNVSLSTEDGAFEIEKQLWMFSNINQNFSSVPFQVTTQFMKSDLSFSFSVLQADGTITTIQNGSLYGGDYAYQSVSVYNPANSSCQQLQYYSSDEAVLLCFQNPTNQTNGLTVYFVNTTQAAATSNYTFNNPYDFQVNLTRTASYWDTSLNQTKVFNFIPTSLYGESNLTQVLYCYNHIQVKGQFVLQQVAYQPTDFGLSSWDLVDIRVLNQTVYLLNNLPGNKSQVIVFEVFNDIISHLYVLNYTETAWGFAVDQYIDKIIITVVHSNQISEYEYITDLQYNNAATYTNKQAGQFNSLVRVETALNFYTVSIYSNNLYQIFQRSLGRMALYAQQYFGWATTIPNNMFLTYHAGMIQLDLIQTPQLVFEVNIVQVYQQIVLTFTSEYNGKQEVCELTFQDIYLLVQGDKGMVANFEEDLVPVGTSAPADYYFQYPLSPYFWGPDVSFALASTNLTNSSIVDIQYNYVMKPVAVEFLGYPTQLKRPEVLVSAYIPINQFDYYYLESNNQVLNFYRCSLSPVSWELAKCLNLNSTELSSPILSVQIGKCNGFEQYFIQLNNSNSILVYSVMGTLSANVNTQNTLVSFSVNLELVFLITKNASTGLPLVEVFSTSSQFPKFQSVLGQQAVESWGVLNYTTQFNPSRVANSYENIFILNNNNQIIYTILRNGVFYLQFIDPNQNQQKITNMFIAGNNLITVSADRITRQQLTSLPNLLSYQAQYSINLYENNLIQEPSQLTVTPSANGYFLFVLALNTNTNSTVLLVLKPDQDQFNVLYTFRDIIPYPLSSSGPIYQFSNGQSSLSPYNLYFLQANGGYFTFFIPHDKGVQYYVNPNSTTLVQNIQFSYYASGNDGAEPLLNQSSVVQVYRTQTQVSLNLTNIKSQETQRKFIFRQVSGRQSIKFNANNWVSGSFLGFSVQTYDQNCPNLDCFEILNRVRVENGANQAPLDNNFDTFWDGTSGTLYTLFEQSGAYQVAGLNSSLQLKVQPTVLTQIPVSQVKCYYLLPNFYESGQLNNMFAICQNRSNSVYVIVPVQLYNEELMSGTPIFLPQVSSLGGLGWAFNQYLVVLDAAQSEANGIQFYELNYEKSTAKPFQVLSPSSWSLPSGTYLTTFDLVGSGSQLFVLAGTSDGQLLAAQESQASQNFTDFRVVNVSSYLNPQTGVILSAGASVNKVIALNSNPFGQSFNLVVSVQGSPLYQLQWNYTTPSNQSLAVTQVFFTYGPNNQILSIKLFQGYLSVLYQNPKLKTITLTVYNNQLNILPGQQAQQTFFGGFVFEYSASSPNNFAGLNFIQNPAGKIFIANIQNSNGNLQLVSINEDYELTADTYYLTTGVYQVSFQAESEFALVATGQFYLPVLVQNFNQQPYIQASASISEISQKLDQSPEETYSTELIVASSLLLLLTFAAKFIRSKKSSSSKSLLVQSDSASNLEILSQ